METQNPDPVTAALTALRAQMADTSTCSWCPEPAAGTASDLVLDPDVPTSQTPHFSCGRPGHGRDFTYGPGMVDLPSLVSAVGDLLRATDPRTYAGQADDGLDRAPATNRLGCSYCGGTVAPELEYSGHAYSEHRDWTGTECEGCGATWKTDGTPNEGPWLASLRYELDKRAKEQADAH